MHEPDPTTTGPRLRGGPFYRPLRVSQPWIKAAALFVLLPAGYAFLIRTRIGCVWRKLLGVPCPGCGMTRALRALLRGDWAGMLRWHFMAPFLPLVLWYILFDGRLLADRRADAAVLSALAAGYLTRWALALFGVLPV